MAYKGQLGCSTTSINIKKECLLKEKLKEYTPRCNECLFYKFKDFKCSRDKRSKQKNPKKCNKFMFKSYTNISF